MKTTDLYEIKQKCCGCWACESVCPKSAISMQPDNEGFLYPVVNQEKCIDCYACIRVCPVKSSAHRIESEEKQRHIGIINLQFTQNYGAVIAAAVLQNIVEKIVNNTYVVQTIDYRPFRLFGNRFAQKADEIKDYGGLKLFLKSRKQAADSSISIDDSIKRKQRFDIFRDSYLNLTPVFQNAYEINSKVNYFAFIVGSDIVWAPKRADNFRADGYFLKFADKGEKKISYAASLDCRVGRKLNGMKACYKDNLKYLDCISVREKSSVDFIQTLTDKKVYECCDPAFLAQPSFYDDMINGADVNQDNRKFIYVYILELNPEIVSYANKLSAEKDLKICYYSQFHKEYNENSEDCIADGPAEFLYRLKNAEYVLTNSFHCLVFSLLFKKKFLSFGRSKISIKSTDLLSKFDLTDRFVIDADSNIDIDQPIDFEKVERTIKIMRKDSINYLSQSLKDIINQEEDI